MDRDSRSPSWEPVWCLPTVVAVCLFSDRVRDLWAPASCLCVKVCARSVGLALLSLFLLLWRR